MTKKCDEQVIEENIEEINEMLETEKGFLGKIKQKVYLSNGFMTKAKGWIDKTEWHATAIGISWASLAFAFPTPFDAMFIVSYGLFMKKVVDGEAFPNSQLGDSASQFAYTLPFYTVTVWYFILFTDFGVESIDVGSMIISMIVGG